jgi:hypothetical protein
MHWKDIPFDATPTMLRRFGAVGSLLVLLAAAWQFWHDRWLIGGALLGVSLLFAVFVLLWPRALRPVFVGMMVATFPINWVVSHLVLAVIFYCVFTPVALLFRLVGRDVLARHAGAARDSYWSPKAGAEGVRSYFRQS